MSEEKVLDTDAQNKDAKHTVYEFMRQFVQTTEDRDNGTNGKTKDDYGWDFVKVRGHEESNSGTFDHARKLENIAKNRYRDIIPYDHTRVLLKDRKNCKGNYINANFINGASGNIEYIATMGPQQNTIEDFWRMVLDQKSTVIVMLCQLMENGKPKCERYWPLKGEPLIILDQTITLITEQPVNDNYIRRHLKVKPATSAMEPSDSKENNGYIIYHLQYSDWPDYGRPERVEPMLELIDEMHRTHLSYSPIIIHCSAGCGRTGAIIAVDTAAQLIKTKRMTPSFDVVTLVTDLRKQRPAMVQSLDQFTLVNHAIAELFRRQLFFLDEHHYVNMEEYKNYRKKEDENIGAEVTKDNQMKENKDETPVVKLGSMTVNDYPHAPLKAPRGSQPIPEHFLKDIEVTTERL